MSHRRRAPALTLLLVFGLAAAAVWAHVLDGERDLTRRVSCPPAPGDPAVTPVPYRALRHVMPLPPGQVEVRVRNATGQRGLAARVTARLVLFGFATTEPDNDTRYPAGTMHCTAQIRFGPDGRAAARTLSLMAPCAQLVRDERKGPAVDVALGTGFTELHPTDAASEVLRKLRRAAEHRQSSGGLQSLGARSAPDPALEDPLAGARPGRC